MADIYQAKAAVVKVSVGSSEGNRVARIIRAGGVIPEGVDQDLLEKLTKRGLIEKVTSEEGPAAPQDAAEPEDPKAGSVKASTATAAKK